MKKILSVLCILLIVSIHKVNAITSINTGIYNPEVTFVGIGHSPLVEGETESYILLSSYNKKVKYNVFLYNESSKTYTSITKGYGNFTEASEPFQIDSDYIFKKGKYKLYVYVIGEGIMKHKKGSLTEYDNVYVANMNCVAKDDKNRVYTNSGIATNALTIAEGEEVKGFINNISGMEAPYRFKMHLYDINKKQWILDDTYKSEYALKNGLKVGKYIVDIWVTSSDSKAKYEGWSLGIIEVVNNTFEYPNSSGINIPIDSIFNKYIKFGTSTNSTLGSFYHKYGSTKIFVPLIEGAADIYTKENDVMKANQYLKEEETRILSNGLIKEKFNINGEIQEWSFSNIKLDNVNKFETYCNNVLKLYEEYNNRFTEMSDSKNYILTSKVLYDKSTNKNTVYVFKFKCDKN